MTRSSARLRFSLRDVFVVVASVGVLLAMLVYWIRVSREEARRIQCYDNLRNIVTALQNYHSTHNSFPMGARHAGPNPGSDPPIDATLGPSWWFGIMPFLQQRNRYDMIVATQQLGGPATRSFCANDMHVAGVSLNTFLLECWRCPASPLPIMETSKGPIALPTYVGIAGGCDIDPNSQDYDEVRGTAAGLMALKMGKTYETRHEGTIHHNTHKGTGAAAGGIATSSGMLPPCQHVRLADCIDGTSNVMIVGEQSDWLLDRNPASSKKYHGDPGWTVGGTGSGGGWLSGTRRIDPIPAASKLGGPPTPWGADCWTITTVRYPSNFKRVMGTTPLPGCSENHGINNPLQSRHGGVQVGMVDGSVQFISQRADLEWLLRLSIRNDGVPMTIDSD